MLLTKSPPIPTFETNMKKLLIAFLCLVGFTQCNNKVYSLQNLPKQFIEIGSYGGFTGMQESYFLMPNGQRFFNNSMPGDTNFSNAIEIERAEPKVFKEAIKDLKKMDFDKIDLNENGNMNYFIRLKKKKEEQQVVWSNMDTAPAELVSFYKTSIKNLKTDAIQ